MAEALALLHDLGPSAPAGGPLADRGGVLWVELPERHLEAALARLPRLGYCTAVDLVEAAPAVAGRRRARDPGWRLVRVHTEDPGGHREQAPDRREFLVEGAGGLRPVRGYRGDGHALGRRGLPVCDARLLVNLVAPAGPGLLVDPFAGVGGVALAAAAAGWTAVTADRDPALRHGLGRLGAGHLVADARRLPLRPASVDAVATEPPYDPSVGPLAAQALDEVARLLRPGGATAWLCAAWQARGLRAAAAGLGLDPALDTPVDRKGTPVVALAWRRPR
ncbi:MAG TPA: methyltransferase domain-containing protein [Actinomycetota bacterium]|nr:methyltransferase domain-containing protein [Actinomycetota bacterium]